MLNEKIKYIEDIFNNLVEAVITADMDLVINGWNKAAEKMYGWKKKEVVGKVFSDVLKPEHLGESRDSVIDRFFKDKFYKGEAVCKRKDGSDVIVFSSVSMITDNEGNNIGVVAINRDITEQKKMQEELKRSEEKFRVAFHTSPDAVNINRLSDGKYIEINDGFTKMSGYKKSDVLGKTSLELGIWVNPRDRQNVVDRLMKEGKVYNYEAQFRMKDGSIKTGVMSAHIIELNGEKHILSITRDVTEQKKIEKELIESEQKFKDLTEKSLVGVYLFADGKFKYVNPKIAEIFGYKVEEMIDKLGPDDLTFPADREMVLQNISKRIKGDVNFLSYSFRGLKKDSTVIYLEVFGSRTTIGGKPAVVGTLLDITERKLIEDRLRKSEKRYRELFEFSPVALWEEDFTQLINYLNKLKEQGVDNFRDYFNNNPGEVKKCARLVNILDVNQAAVKLHEAKSKNEMLGDITNVITKDSYDALKKEIIDLANGKKKIQIESTIQTPSSGKRYVIVNVSISEEGDDNNRIYRGFVSSSDITEIKLAERSLRESEIRYRSIVENAAEGISITNEEGKLIEWNRKLEEITGITAVSVLGKYVWDILADIKAPKLKQRVNKSKLKAEILDFLKSGKSDYNHQLLERPYIRPDGTKLDVELRIFSVKTDKGYMLVNTTEDITVRKYAERALKESEERYRHLFEYSPISLWQDDYTDLYNYLNILKESGVTNIRKYLDENPDEVKRGIQMVKVIDVNKATLRLYDAESKEEVINNLNKIISRDTFRIFKEIMIGIFKGKDQIRIEGKMKSFKGETRYVTIDVYLENLFGSDRHNYYALVAVTNITQIKEAENEIRKNRDMLLKAQQIAKIGFFSWNINTNKITISDQIFDLLKLERKESLDFEELVNNFLFEDDFNFIVGELEAAKKGERDFDLIHRIKRSDGAERWVHVQAELLTENTGDQLTLFGTILDITDLKEVENRLRESRNRIRNLAKKLQSIREEERAYIAREIHDDLGQSLTALKMDLSWMLKKIDEYNKDKLSIKIAEMLSLIDASIQNVKRIIYELRPSILDDLGLCPAIEWQSKEFERRTGINCSIVTDPNPVNLNTDLATAVFRIFQETLTNIARHSKAKNVSGSVLFRDNKVCLKVVDDGIGITEEQLNNHYSFGILGMKERAQMWDGTVDIKGIKNKGTEVVVEIPVK